MSGLSIEYVYGICSVSGSGDQGLGAAFHVVEGLISYAQDRRVFLW